jgi:hypothetical protein
MPHLLDREKQALDKSFRDAISWMVCDILGLTERFADNRTESQTVCRCDEWTCLHVGGDAQQIELLVYVNLTVNTVDFSGSNLDFDNVTETIDRVSNLLTSSLYDATAFYEFLVFVFDHDDLRNAFGETAWIESPQVQVLASYPPWNNADGEGSRLPSPTHSPTIVPSSLNIYHMDSSNENDDAFSTLTPAQKVAVITMTVAIVLIPCMFLCCYCYDREVAVRLDGSLDEMTEPSTLTALPTEEALYASSSMIWRGLQHQTHVVSHLVGMARSRFNQYRVTAIETSPETVMELPQIVSITESVNVDAVTTTRDAISLQA